MSDFVVDLQDPASVAAALERAQRLVSAAEVRYDAARSNLEEATARERGAIAEVERLRALALTLRNAGDIVATITPDMDASGDAASSKARALEIVTAINGRTSIAEVAKYMPDFKRKTVGWAMWTLGHEGAIQALGNGAYAPNGWTSARPTTNYAHIPEGFPRPQAPGPKTRQSAEHAQATLSSVQEDDEDS